MESILGFTSAFEQREDTRRGRKERTQGEDTFTAEEEDKDISTAQEEEEEVDSALDTDLFCAIALCFFKYMF